MKFIDSGALDEARTVPDVAGRRHLHPPRRAFAAPCRAAPRRDAPRRAAPRLSFVSRRTVRPLARCLRQILLHDHNEFIHRDIFLEGVGVFEKVIENLANAK